LRSQVPNLRMDSLWSLQLHIAVGSPAPPEKADHQRALPKQVGGIHLDMILIEQGEFRSAVSGSQRFIRKPRSFELGASAMHRFDGFPRCVIRRSSGFKRLLEFI